MLGKRLCSSLSATTFLHTSVQLPMGRRARADRPCCALLCCAWAAWAPSLLTAGVRRGHPHSSLTPAALAVSLRSKSVWPLAGAQSPCLMCLTVLVPWEHCGRGFPAVRLPRPQPLDNFHPKRMSHFLPVKTKYLHEARVTWRPLRYRKLEAAAIL